jgi:1-acyl-sn-glycerol-3-phosphate acyltransferase
MKPTVRQLRLPDLIFNRKGSLLFRTLLTAFGVALRLFFRRIETVNADVVPKRGGLIFVLNHPNGLIDPALVFVALPRRISFLAKSTLFRMPVISMILKTVEALPLYRKIDPGEDVTRNRLTFEASRDMLSRGGSIALFPEGVSHNSPKLLPIKSGAARIALGAASVNSGSEPVAIRIVPVGLYYTSKTTFRSEAMLHFGEPFAVEPVQLDNDGEPPRETVRELTTRIENALREVTLNAETDADLSNAQIAEEIVATAAPSDRLLDKRDFLRRYILQTGKKSDVGRAAGLDDKLQLYDRKLATHGLEPVHLTLAELPQSFVIRQAIVQSWWLVLLLPLSAAGTILHFPAYQLCKLLAFLFTHHGADDIVSTVKVLAAMVFMPLTWLTAAAVVYFLVGWEFALLSIPISIVLGFIALHSLERFAELRGWARAIWIFLTDREAFLRMFLERRELQEKLSEIEA